MKKAIEILTGVMVVLISNGFMFWALFLAPWEMAI